MRLLPARFTCSYAPCNKRCPPVGPISVNLSAKSWKSELSPPLSKGGRGDFLDLEIPLAPFSKGGTRKNRAPNYRFWKAYQPELTLMPVGPPGLADSVIPLYKNVIGELSDRGQKLVRLPHIETLPNITPPCNPIAVCPFCVPGQPCRSYDSATTCSKQIGPWPTPFPRPALPGTWKPVPCRA